MGKALAAFLALIVATAVFFMATPSLQPPFGAIDSPDEIKTLQSEYFAKEGKYLQVKEGGQLPEYEAGTVKGKLGVDVASNVIVDTYETPKGEKGYQVITKTPTLISSVGVGAEADDRTYAYPIVSTSSPAVQLDGLLGWAYPLAYALTSNTHSTDLERGSSQYWSIADASQTGLDGGAAMTFCAWINLESYNTAGDHHNIVGKGSATGSTRQFRWSVRGGGGVTTYVFQASSAGSSFDGDTSVTGTEITTATWYHLCAVFDGANTDTLYYKDGAQVGTTQNNGISALFNSSRAFSVGAENVGVTPAEFFDGKIDDLRVWTRVLSATEIADQYNSPCDDTKLGANNSAQWLFDNDALDVTANNNDLTGTNSPTFSTTHAYDCAAAGGAVQEDEEETIWWQP